MRLRKNAGVEAAQAVSASRVADALAALREVTDERARVCAELASRISRREALAENAHAFSENERAIRELEASRTRLEIIVPRREGELAEARQRLAVEERRRPLSQVVDWIVYGGDRRGMATDPVTPRQLDDAFLGLTEREREQTLRRAEDRLEDVEREIKSRYRLRTSLYGPDSDLANRNVANTIVMIRERIERLRELTLERV